MNSSDVMTEQERNNLIESYCKGSDQVRALLDELPEEMWRFRPTPWAWSVHEIIVHLADSDVHGYVRLRTTIAEPGGSMTVYDQEAWTATLDYSERSMQDSLELLRLVRRLTCNLLRNMPGLVWEQGTYHPDHGRIRFDELLNHYVRHVQTHVEQMKRNYQAWTSTLSG